MNDILIVGGGVIGLSVARELRRCGAGAITVLEQGAAGRASSWAAAGMLSPQADTDVGGKMLDLCVAGREAYPRFAEELFDETGIDIELDRKGTLYLAFDEAEAERLRGRVKWQTDAGLRAENLTGGETRRAEPFVSPDVTGGAYFPDDWQVENRKLLDALRKYAANNGITIAEQSRVTELMNDRGRITGVRTEAGEFTADATVLTTGAWTSLIKLGAFQVPLSIKPIRGQMICYRTAKRLYEHVIYSSSGYLVPRIDGRVLAGATSEDVGFENCVTEAGVTMLADAAAKMAPALAGLGIMDKWAGLRPMPVDGSPIIGAMSGLDGLFVATGHYRNGILLAPLTADLLADHMLNGTRSPLLEHFGPDRFANAGVNSIGR